MSATGPSEHLSWDELCCHDPARTPYPEDWMETRAIELAAMFEAFRAWCGNEPMIVDSGYRTREWNVTCGGAKTSQHVEGRALDLRRPGWDIAQLHAEAKKFAVAHPAMVGGVGLYPTFVHLDTRASARLVVWNGGRPAAEDV